jgi:ABC-2 type transport system permease protein
MVEQSDKPVHANRLTGSPAHRLTSAGSPAHRLTSAGSPAHRRTHARFLSNVLAIAYKEATVLRHDQAFIATVLMQPIMLLLLFGFALSFKPANVPWAVLDQSRTEISRRFLADVQTTGYFLPPQPVASYDEGERLLRHGSVIAFVVVPPEFRRAVERGQPRVQVVLDGTDPITAARVGGYISMVGAAFDVGRDSSAALVATAPLDLRQRFFFNPAMRDRDFFLAALAGMLLTNLCLSVTSLGIVGERESGTFEHMLASPTTSLEIILGKLAPLVVISYGVLLLAVLLSGLCFGFWPRGSLIALAVVTLPFVLASLSIGAFVSTLATTSAQAVFITVFFILPSFVLSGSMIPYQLMPPGVREVGYALPLRWYQIAQRRIIERGAGLSEVVGPTLALTLFFVGMLLLIRWRMKPRLA